MCLMLWFRRRGRYIIRGKRIRKWVRYCGRVNSVLDNERIAKTIESLEQDGIKNDNLKSGNKLPLSDVESHIWRR